ncbi:MAG: hypothetical protein ACI4DU_08450 [Lachnospiraceae bacterium]
MSNKKIDSANNSIEAKLRRNLQEKYENHESNYVTLLELMTGNLIFGLLCQIVIILIGKKVGYYSLGLWIGSIAACGLAVHMNHTIAKAILSGEEDAPKVNKQGSLLRYAMVLILLGVLMCFDFANPLTAFLGIMGLKIGAYMQPLVHRITKKIAPELCVLPEPLILTDDEDAPVAENAKTDGDAASAGNAKTDGDAASAGNAKTHEDAPVAENAQNEDASFLK